MNIETKDITAVYNAARWFASKRRTEEAKLYRHTLYNMVFVLQQPVALFWYGRQHSNTKRWLRSVGASK